MPPKPPRRIPLTPTTVTIDSSEWPGTALIWAMPRWSEGVAKLGFSSRDHVLSVPMCEPDDDIPSADCGWSRIRPKDRYADYRFVKQRNGAWMLVLEGAV